MQIYEDIILTFISGETPKEKHDNLIQIMRILSEISNPRRGTKEEVKTLQDFADEINNSNLIAVNYDFVFGN